MLFIVCGCYWFVSLLDESVMFWSTRWVALRLIVWWFALLFDFVVIVVALWLDLFVVSLGYSVDFGFCFWDYGVAIVV